MSESKVKDGKYILIQSFMVKELNLKGNELLIYAIIYGFSQDEETKFSGSLKYLADWTNSTKQGVIKCLKSLESNSLIHKLEIIKNGVKFCEYYATKFNTPMQQSLIGGIKQSLPNNISLDNIDNNIDTSKIEKLPLEAKKEIKEIKNKEISVKIEKSELEKTFDDFLQMRKSIRKPATEKAIQLIKEKIKKLAQGSEKMAIDILNQSIVNSWQDVFPLKVESKQFEIQKSEIPLRRKAL